MCQKGWSLTILQACSLSSKGNGDQDVGVGDPLLLLEGSLGEAEDLGEGILTSRKTSLKCWRDSSPFQGRDSLAGWLGIRTKEGLLSLPSGLGLG